MSVTYTINSDEVLNDIEVKLTGNLLSFRYTSLPNSFSYAIANQMGQVITKGEIIDEHQTLDLSNLKPGFYNLLLMRGLKRKNIPIKL